MNFNSKVLLKNRLVGLLLLASVFFAGVDSAFAFSTPSIDTQKHPVEIQGDYLEYKTKSNQVITKGNAYITYQDMRISADTIQANTETEDIFAQGNVDFWKGYDQTKGDFVVYNMKKGEGWLRDTKVINKRQIFTAKDAYLSPSYNIAHDITQTTCDHDNPHYCIKASKMENRPNKDMNLEGLKLKWGAKTLYTKAYDNSTAKKENKFFKTRQGVSSVDGQYFKFTTDIMLNEHMSGVVNLDYFEKRGTGFGASGRYKLGERGNGSIYFYNLNESKKGHTNVQTSISHNQNFVGGENLALNLNYTGDQYSGMAENQDLTVQLNFRPVLNFMTMSITANKFYDLDKDRYTADDGYTILNRLPEINFSFPAYKTPYVPLTMAFSGMYGKYEEGTLKDIKDTEKKDGKMSFTVPTVEVNDRFNFTPSYNFQKSFYSNGTERENGSTMVRATHKFSNVANLDFNYNISTSKGKSPFYFDNVTSTDLTSTRIRFSENSWTLNPINFNYNRVAKRLEQVYWDYTKRSSTTGHKNWEFFLRQDYAPKKASLSDISLSDIKPGNLSGRYRVSTNLWSFDTNITFPRDQGRITNTSFNYSTVIRPLWAVSTSGSYNHITNKFSPLTIGLVRDLHCWEARAEYSHEREEFWIEFYLKAFPGDKGRFRYGMDDNKLQAKIAAYDQLSQRYGDY